MNKLNFDMYSNLKYEGNRSFSWNWQLGFAFKFKNFFNIFKFFKTKG